MTLRFAFYGRVSTEDAQDPEASRSWQKRRAMELVTPHGGIRTADYFDVGQSRALPWKRKPEASRLLADVARRDCGFDAVVIGEPARAFYGPQFALTFPVLTHYGVGLLGARSRRSCRSRVRDPRPGDDVVRRHEQGGACSNPNACAHGHVSTRAGHDKVPRRPAVVIVVVRSVVSSRFETAAFPPLPHTRRSCPDDRMCQGWRSHQRGDVEDALYAADRAVRQCGMRWRLIRRRRGWWDCGC